MLDSDATLDLLVAIRKGKHQRTYLISSFVSYDYLFSPCSFIASLDTMLRSHIVHEALSHPKWHGATVREMVALIIMVHSLWWIYLWKRELLVANVCLLSRLILIA